MKDEIFEGKITRDSIIEMKKGDRKRISIENEKSLRTRAGEANVAARMAGLPSRWRVSSMCKDLGYIEIVRIN